MSNVRAVTLRPLAAEPLVVRIVGEAALPSRFGEFRAVAFENNRDGREHLALLHSEWRRTGDARGLDVPGHPVGEVPRAGFSLKGQVLSRPRGAR